MNMQVTLSRAERRRIEAEARRAKRYGKSGFIDRAVYAPNSVKPQRPGKERFTPDQLQQRAIERRDFYRRLAQAYGRPQTNRAPHAPTGTPERRHKDRSDAKARAEAAFLAGLKKTQPKKYLNASRRRAGLIAEAV